MLKKTSNHYLPRLLSIHHQTHENHFSKKMEGNSNSVEWKEIAILKLLFPSIPYFLTDLKVEGNSNGNGRK